MPSWKPNCPWPWSAACGAPKALAPSSERVDEAEADSVARAAWTTVGSESALVPPPQPASAVPATTTRSGRAQRSATRRSANAAHSNRSQAVVWCANWVSAATSERSRSPRGVSTYSTRGGRVSTTRRSSTPACSSSRRRAFSVAGGTEPSTCRNSLKRTAPSYEAQRIETVQRRSRRSAARRISSGSGAHLRQRMCGRLRLEREREHLAEAHHRVERHLVTDIGGDVVEVGAVALRDDDVGQPRCVRGERLLLQPADRQHATLQRHLAGHADRVLDRAAREERRERGRHRDAGARAVLRDRARGDVHVEAGVVERLLFDSELGGVRADVGERDARRLLHHVAELPGEHEVLPAVHPGRLDEEHVAAGAC